MVVTKLLMRIKLFEGSLSRLTSICCPSPIVLCPQASFILPFESVIKCKTDTTPDFPRERTSLPIATRREWQVREPHALYVHFSSKSCQRLVPGRQALLALLPSVLNKLSLHEKCSISPDDPTYGHPGDLWTDLWQNKLKAFFWDDACLSRRKSSCMRV